MGQVASFVWFDDKEKDNDLKRMLRDHIHLREEIFFYASLLVQKLGAFQYAALHIRRNELQYKQSFIAAEQSLKHIKPLLKDNEVIYIATDEKDPKFFEAMEKEYRVYRWKDFVEKDGSMYLGDDVDIPRKYEGVVEMAVCGMGRKRSAVVKGGVGRQPAELLDRYPGTRRGAPGIAAPEAGRRRLTPCLLQ